MEEEEKKVAGEKEKEENKEDKFMPMNIWESKVVQEVFADLKIIRWTCVRAGIISFEIMD